jgi:hypothetical protein
MLLGISSVGFQLRSWAYRELKRALRRQNLAERETAPQPSIRGAVRSIFLPKTPTDEAFSAFQFGRTENPVIFVREIEASSLAAICGSGAFHAFSLP